jgi:SAM-dependent methyltransferase
MEKLNKKYKRELNFWITKWTDKLKYDWWSSDIKTLLKIKKLPEFFSEEQRKRHESRALFLRLLKETRIKNKRFFKDKIVLDIGPGPMGLLEASDAKIKIAIEPLAKYFRKYKLLLKDSDVTYLNIPAEKLPFLNETMDIVISRNNLDHVGNPRKVINEVFKVLKVNGYFILNVDINHPPLVAEPHKITQKMIKNMTKNFKLIRKIIYDKPHGWKGKMFVALYQKPKTK